MRWRAGVFGGQLFDAGPRQALVEHLDQVWAFVDGVLGRASGCVGEEVPGRDGPRDEVVERGDLLAEVVAPPVARLVKQGGRSVQADAEPLHDLYQREPA